MYIHSMPLDPYWPIFVTMQGVNYVNSLSHQEKSMVLTMTRQMTELLELQTLVNQVLEEEGENASIETKARSAIVIKTFEQACKWVSSL